MASEYRQVKLRSGERELVTNLRDHAALKVGNSIKLTDHPEPSRWWLIEWVASSARRQPETRWRVGGLF